MKITILGSGTSTGVPEIGCKCPVCTSNDPRDNRLRCSGLIETEGVRILMDCGPDFREQMIRLNDFKPLDAVFISHEHYDHVGGLDDLRPFCRLRDVPVYAERYTAERLRQRIPYCFAEHLYPGVPRILLKEIVPDSPFTVGNSKKAKVEIIPVRVMHGKLPILGYRIGNMAWITDMLTMPGGAGGRGEAASLAVGDMGVPDAVQKRCFTVVNVSDCTDVNVRFTTIVFFFCHLGKASNKIYFIDRQ